MDETQFQLVRAAGFACAVALALALQRLLPHTGERGGWRVNAGLWIVNLVVVGGICGACACTAARWAASQGIGLFHAVSVPPGLVVLLTILSLDFVSYAWHRANHRLSFLWRFHQVHHSDRRFRASTAARFHPGELVLSLPLRLLAVVGLGASPLGVVLFEMVFALSNFFEHGDIELPDPLDRGLGRVLITPALHRRHHSLRLQELNRNFGTIFSLWDRLLATYLASSPGDRVAVGLPGRIAAPDLRGALFLPLRRGPSIR